MTHGQVVKQGVTDNPWSIESYSVKTGWVSQYVLANGAVLYNKPTVQTDLSVSLKNRVFFDVWNSLPLDLGEIGENFSTELDFTIGYTTVVKDYSVSVSVNYYDLKDSLTFDSSDIATVILNVGRTYEVTQNTSINLFFKSETMFAMSGDSLFETFPRIGVSTTHQINEHWSIFQKNYILHDAGAFGADSAFIMNSEVGVIYSNQDWTIEVANLKYFTPISGGDDRDQELVFGMNISYRR